MVMLTAAFGKPDDLGPVGSRKDEFTASFFVSTDQRGSQPLSRAFATSDSIMSLARSGKSIASSGIWLR